MSAATTTGTTTGTGHAGGLPKLVRGDRRRIMALLVGTGLLLAALAALTAVFMTMLLGAGADPTAVAIAGCGLVTAALGIGVLRSAERVLAERLGQSYIQDIRIGLIQGSLTADKPPAAGITIARATNDLTSVRNWVALGIAPLAVGIPLILGATLGLTFLSPVLALAAFVPLLVLAVLMVLLARAAFDRAKIVRRRRGRLASLLADTVAAASAIRAAGGEKRELRRIAKAGQDVVDAAVNRSRIAGYIRGAAAAAAAFTVAAAGIAGLLQSIDTATIAGALTIVGLTAAPVSEMGRVVEYRQNFNAARRILGPALALPGPVRPAGASAAPQHRPDGSSSPGNGLVSVVAPRSDDDAAPPTLLSKPGDIVLIRTSDPARADALFGALLGLQSGGAPTHVDGVDLRFADAETKRRLVGYAAVGSYLERGTIGRAVRYRRPDVDPARGLEALDRIGLAGTIEALPKRERTKLRRGGEPLTVSERARLLLARAALANPPLLILNRIDADLDDDGQLALRKLILDYPGVVLMAPGNVHGVALPHDDGRVRDWDIDGPAESGRAPRKEAELFGRR